MTKGEVGTGASGEANVRTPPWCSCAGRPRASLRGPSRGAAQARPPPSPDPRTPTAPQPQTPGRAPHPSPQRRRTRQPRPRLYRRSPHRCAAGPPPRARPRTKLCAPGASLSAALRRACRPTGSAGGGGSAQASPAVEWDDAADARVAKGTGARRTSHGQVFSRRVRVQRTFDVPCRFQQSTQPPAASASTAACACR